MLSLVYKKQIIVPDEYISSLRDKGCKCSLPHPTLLTQYVIICASCRTLAMI